VCSCTSSDLDSLSPLSPFAGVGWVELRIELGVEREEWEGEVAGEVEVEVEVEWEGVEEWTAMDCTCRTAMGPCGPPVGEVEECVVMWIQESRAMKQSLKVGSLHV